MAGFFVSVEGIEGSGKSTQIARLAQVLRAQGREVVVTREPGGTPVGQILRRLLLDPSAPPLAPGAELLLMLADRAQHVQEVVAPGLRANTIVISCFTASRFQCAAFQFIRKSIRRSYFDTAK